jgi:hypothetical protein
LFLAIAGILFCREQGVRRGRATTGSADERTFVMPLLELS